MVSMCSQNEEALFRLRVCMQYGLKIKIMPLGFKSTYECKPTETGFSVTEIKFQIEIIF